MSFSNVVLLFYEFQPQQSFLFYLFIGDIQEWAKDDVEEKIEKEMEAELLAK